MVGGSYSYSQRRAMPRQARASVVLEPHEYCGCLPIALCHDEHALCAVSVNRDDPGIPCPHGLVVCFSLIITRFTPIPGDVTKQNARRADPSSPHRLGCSCRDDDGPEGE